MNLAQYLPLALRTEKKLPTAQERLEHALLGLITETGEIATEVKRMAIYGKPLDDARRAHIAEEIGDVLWYLAIGADVVEPRIFLEYVDIPVWDTEVEMPGIKLTCMAMGSVVGDLVDHVMSGDHGEVPALLDNALKICWCYAQLIGIPLGQIAADNIAKLQERFPDAYSNEAAEARADKGGLDARNS